MSGDSKENFMDVIWYIITVYRDAYFTYIYFAWLVINEGTLYR